MDREKMISRVVKFGENPQEAVKMLDRIFDQNKKNQYNLVFELRYWNFISDYQANKILMIEK